MGYAMRYFTVTSVVSLVPALEKVVRAGMKVRLVGTEAYDIYYEPAAHPLATGMSKSCSPAAQSEVAVFIELVSQRPPLAGKRDVLHTLSCTQAIVAIGVPDDFSLHGDDETLSFVTESVADLGQGMFQIDGQGFFVGKHLVFQLH